MSKDCPKVRDFNECGSSIELDQHGRRQAQGSDQVRKVIRSVPSQKRYA